MFGSGQFSGLMFETDPWLFPLWGQTSKHTNPKVEKENEIGQWQSHQNQGENWA